MFKTKALNIRHNGFMDSTPEAYVRPVQKEQVGDLLDYFERIGDTAGPEGVPDLVDLAFD